MDIFKNYESLWKSIIRPTRQTYNVSDLGPSVILTKESREKVKRIDFDLKNKLGLTLKCSYYEFVERNNPQPCVLYLHCNSGSRLEGQLYVENLVNKGMSVCIFDFAGSGQSEGEYISLGYYELGDVEIVVNYLKQNWQISKIGIWGRSMGAVTGLMYIQNDQSIMCGCFDSPFSNFMKLAAEIGSMKTGLPKFLIKGALSLVQSTILEKAKFNIEDLDVLKNLDKSNIPCLFVASKQDSFVKSHHSEKIQKNYKGENKMIYFDGDHHEQRPVKLVRDCCEFFEKNLILNKQNDIPQQMKVQENITMPSMFSQQQIQQTQYGQQSPISGKANIPQQQQQSFTQMNQQQQAMQRSRIKSVQAPNTFMNNLCQSIERGNNSNLENFMSTKDPRSNQNVPIPSSQPLIHLPANSTTTTNPTIHHAHSRSSTPNIQINLDRKFNGINSEQKTSGPAAPMIPQSAISIFDARQPPSQQTAQRNADQKNSSRINSFHTSGTANNQFNFNQPTQQTANPLNMTLIQDNNIPQQQFISNNPIPNTGSSSNTHQQQQVNTLVHHQPQRSITMVSQNQNQQQSINVLGNTPNNNLIYARERSNTSFTSAMDFHREVTPNIANQYQTINSTQKTPNHQAPQTPIMHSQPFNGDTSIDYPQNKIGYTPSSATPSNAIFGRQQTPTVHNSNNNVNVNFRQASSPHGGTFTQQLPFQPIHSSNIKNNNNTQQNLLKSQSLNVNENLVTGSSNQGDTSIIVKSIPINSMGQATTTGGQLGTHVKNGSRSQFDNIISMPQSLESSVQPGEFQNRYRATTMDITQPLRSDSAQVNDFSLTPQSNTFTTNNITYKINRPRIQNNNNTNFTQFQQPEQLFQKISFAKQSSLVADELSSNNSIPASSSNTTTNINNNQGSSSTNSTSNQSKNNQIITQLSNNNKSSININNQSIISLNEQQLTLVSPRQANNQSIASSLTNASNNNLLANLTNGNITSNNSANNTNNNSLLFNNTGNINTFVKIGQEMSKECKTGNAKVTNAEGDNESIISCDSMIMNKSIMINNSSSKKPGTMNHTPVQGVTTPHMSKSTNHNAYMQQQINNSGKKQQQQIQQNPKNLQYATNMSSSKSSNVLPTKNTDLQYNDNMNCVTPRNKNGNNSAQKMSSANGNSASNQKSKSNKNTSNNTNVVVNQFSTQVNANTSANRNNNNQILNSNSKPSKQMTNNVLQSQSQNVDNKNKMVSAQKIQTIPSYSQVQTQATLNHTTQGTGYSASSNTNTDINNTYIIKGGHQKNQSKFDFKNKRSTNNVPVQRVKFTKNENVSPFQPEIIPANGNNKNIYNNVKINLFDGSERSPTNQQLYQMNQQYVFNKTQTNGNNNAPYLDNFVTAPPPQISKQQSENQTIISRDQYVSTNSKLNDTIDQNNQQKLNDSKMNQTIIDSDFNKKNRSSTTPTFKPDFIKNLQNTKVVHILSKNEELLQQNTSLQKIQQLNSQSGLNSLQNSIPISQVGNAQNYVNYSTQFNPMINNYNLSKVGYNQYANQISSPHYQNKIN